MRFLRVAEPAGQAEAPGPQPPPPDFAPPAGELPPDQLLVHEVTGGSAGAEWNGSAGERLDLIAHRYYGNPAFWKFLARANGIDDPTKIPAGTSLRIPPIPTSG
jgi:nucleoid-associated protein YgaU